MKNYIVLVAIKMINNENLNISIKLRLEKEPSVDDIVMDIMSRQYLKVSQVGVINTSFIGQIVMVEFREDK